MVYPMYLCQTTGHSLTPQSLPHFPKHGDSNMLHPLPATLNPTARLRMPSRQSNDCLPSDRNPVSRSSLLSWTGAPAQHFFGRCCETLLPMSESRLHLHYSTEDTRAINAQNNANNSFTTARLSHTNPLHLGRQCECDLPVCTSAMLSSNANSLGTDQNTREWLVRLINASDYI